jgi:hypothetical protein
MEDEKGKSNKVATEEVRCAVSKNGANLWVGSLDAPW